MDHKLIYLLTFFILIFACHTTSHNYIWLHSNSEYNNLTNFRRDSAECKEYAIHERLRMEIYYNSLHLTPQEKILSSVGRGYQIAKRENEAFANCMYQKGWYKTLTTEGSP